MTSKGLRIDGQKTEVIAQKEEILNTLQKLTEPEEKAAPVKNEKRFNDVMLERFLAVNPNDLAGASLAIESIVATSEAIAKAIGRPKANEFLATVLKATDRKVSESTLGGAITEFFQTVQTELGDGAKETLKPIRELMNKGLEIIDEAQLSESLTKGERPGLAYALNRIFGQKPQNSGPDTVGVLGFDENFDRSVIHVPGQVKEIDPQSQGVSSNGYFVVHSGIGADPETISVPDSVLAETVNFVRNLGSENAAQYLEQAAGTDFLGAIATTFGIIAEEKSQKAAWDFQNYLNNNVAKKVSQINSPAKLEAWHLGPDYGSQEPYSEKSDTLWLSGTDEQTETQLKLLGHQSLSVNWQDPVSGVGTSGKSADIDALYEAYLAQNPAVSQTKLPQESLNEPKGNLVDQWL
jgi:hypothetical protein